MGSEIQIPINPQLAFGLSRPPLPQCRQCGNACGPQVSSPTFITLSPTAQDGSELATEDKDKQQPRGLAQQGSLPPTTLLLGPLADHSKEWVSSLTPAPSPASSEPLI